MRQKTDTYLGKSFAVLDCTLRDGGYRNNWKFSDAFGKGLVEALSSIEIPYVEVGFVLPEEIVRSKSLGKYAISNPSHLEELDFVARTSKHGVMVNASDFSPSELKRAFSNGRQEHIEFVRVAAKPQELDFVGPLIRELESLGLETFLNVMQCHTLIDENLDQVSTIENDTSLSAVYFADSSGSLTPKRLQRLLGEYRTRSSGRIGFHGHDNLGFALSNTLIALEFKDSIVDSTLLGLGRGSGNTRTEQLIALLRGEREFPRLTEMVELAKPEYYFGAPNSIDEAWLFFLCGVMGIHPNYGTSIIENMPDELEQGVKRLLEVPQSRRSAYAELDVEFDLNWYQKNADLDFKGKQARPGRVICKDVLLIAPGSTVGEQKSHIEAFIKERDLQVGVCGAKMLIGDEYVDFRFISNPLSILGMAGNSAGPSKIIGPFGQIPSKYVHSVPESQRVHYYLEKTQDAFNVNERGAALPTHRVFAYALSFIASQGASKVYLAGFDGYTASPELNDEFISFLKHLSGLFPTMEVISLTPTLYPLLPQQLLGGGGN